MQLLDIPAFARFRVCLYGLLEVCERGPDGNWAPIPKERWGKGRDGRLVFKRLLELLWPHEPKVKALREKVFSRQH
jgi:hypothetical protein